MFFRDDTSKTPALNNRYIQKLLQPPKTSHVYNNMTSIFPDKRFSTPVANLQDLNPLVTLKNAIFKEIVNRRLYTDEDLNELFNKTRKANSHINSAIVESAIDQIKQEFDS